MVLETGLPTQDNNYPNIQDNHFDEITDTVLTTIFQCLLASTCKYNCWLLISTSSNKICFRIHRLTRNKNKKGSSAGIPLWGFIPRCRALREPETCDGQSLEECPVWWQYMQAPCLASPCLELLCWTLLAGAEDPRPLAGEHIKYVSQFCDWHGGQQKNEFLLSFFIFYFLTMNKNKFLQIKLFSLKFTSTFSFFPFLCYVIWLIKFM